MKNLKKLNRQEMKSISGGATYSCRCGNGKTATVIASSSAQAGIQLASICNGSGASCVINEA